MYTPERRQEGHRTTRKIFLVGSTILGGILALLCLLCLWWMLNPTYLFEVTPPHTDAKRYQPGGPVTLQYEEFCTQHQKAIQVQRIAVQEETGRRLHFLLYTYAAEDVTLGCLEDLSVEYPLPDDMAPGRWHLETEISYQANPVRAVTQTFVSNSFIVEQEQRAVDEDIVNN
jgi:hypothetical protein